MVQITRNPLNWVFFSELVCAWRVVSPCIQLFFICPTQAFLQFPAFQLAVAMFMCLNSMDQQTIVTAVKCAVSDLCVW